MAIYYRPLNRTLLLDNKFQNYNTYFELPAVFTYSSMSLSLNPYFGAPKTMAPGARAPQPPPVTDKHNEPEIPIPKKHVYVVHDKLLAQFD